MIAAAPALSAALAFPAPLQGTRSAATRGLALFGDYGFADPLLLLGIPVGLALLAWGRSRRARARALVPVADGPGAASLPRSLRQRLAAAPVLLQAAALVLGGVALARPLRASVERDVSTEGVDVLLVVDRSGSMRFEDLAPRRSRLDVVKEVVGDFAERRMTDAEGARDNVGLLTFARYPELRSPFTLDADALRGFLDGVEIVQRREEDGTAIGVALAKAVALLRESDARSRIVVLLTDGLNNVDDIRPLEAARLAEQEGLRVYTVFAAREQYAYDPFAGGYVATGARPDTSELRAIAERTGGRFFEARDEEELEAVYAEIESLERTPRTERRFEEAYDLYPPFLLAALAAYGVAWLSAATWARRLP